MEITFSRTVHYSVSLDDNDIKALAKELELRNKKFVTLVEDGELEVEHYDAIARWLDEKPLTWETTDEENIEDLEVHA
jgi:hypothetical protein